jgi:hypothetical protein
MRRDMPMRAAALLLLCALPALAASPNKSARADTPAPYAKVKWPNTMNPRFVNAGDDRFLLATSAGLQLWDARNNTFTEVAGWPAHADLDMNWARLGAGTVFADREDEVDLDASARQVVHMHENLYWWDAKAQRLSAPLPLGARTALASLVRIDAAHVLVCAARAGLGSTEFEARIVTLHDGALEWEQENSAELRAAALAAGVRGPVRGLGTLDDPALPPVYFKTDECQWDMKARPAFLRGISSLRIKHYRLPDRRIVIGQADWPNSGQLAAPLLWNEAAGRWDALDNTAQRGNDGWIFQAYGIDDPVVSVPTIDPEFVEFLDPETLHWVRSRQSLPQGTYGPMLAPLSTGQALVFLADQQGTILRVDPMRASKPGRLFYNHGKFGLARLSGGRLLFAGGGSQWDPSNRLEILTLPTLSARAIAPLPLQLGFFSTAELPDHSLLAFGGLPPGCGPDGGKTGCDKQAAQPAYRYIPKQDKWEPVANLAIHFANGPFWDAGNSSLINQWPRDDGRVRRNGDFVYLDSGNILGRPYDTQLITTTLIRWRPGMAAPEPLAPLPRGRIRATLLELTGGRLAIIGGLEQPASEEALKAATIQMDFARTTEIYDDRTRLWRTGPAPHYPGGRALRLANGRIFKLSMTHWFVEDGYRAEIADAAFTRWQKLPAFPLPQPFVVDDIVAAGNRVYILPGRRDIKTPDRRVVIWDDDAHKWRVSSKWPAQDPAAYIPLDKKSALALFPQHGGDIVKIVPLPR